MQPIKVKTKEEAREVAKKWQHWQSHQRMTYEDMLQWQRYFEYLAKRFRLKREFKENGII